MAPPSPPRLSPFEERLRVITFTVPIVVVTSYMLYKRLYLGEEQRKLPSRQTDGSDTQRPAPPS